MSKTTNPSPKTKVSTASAWKQSSGVGAPLSVPSGNVCLVRPASMQTLVRHNLIPNELMGIITGAMKTKKAPSLEEMESKMDADQLIAIMNCMDDVVCYMMVEPKVFPTPEEDEEEDPEKLYIHEVDQDDKTFIFQYAVGGTRDLEKFRTGFASYMGSLAEESNVDGTTE